MTHKPRRKSVDSSESSSSSSDSDYKKHKDKAKKVKKDKEKDHDHHHKSRHGDKESSGHKTTPVFPPSSHVEPQMSDCNSNKNQSSHSSGGQYQHQQGYGNQQESRRCGNEMPHHRPPPSENFNQFPPPYTPANQAPPPSGYRIPLTTQTAFPTDTLQTGQPAFIDADGVSPIYIGSALFDRSVHPCKIGPHLQPFASVPYGGGEFGHQGRFDLLPFRPDLMEWVPTEQGRIPSGRRPIEGGYEEHGEKLYHAVAVINGVKVPGKAGEHLYGARIPFGGSEYEISDSYELLCWR